MPVQKLLLTCCGGGGVKAFHNLRKWFFLLLWESLRVIKKYPHKRTLVKTWQRLIYKPVLG
jgi:hypothetical protein